jgi:hypothetical protein
MMNKNMQRVSSALAIGTAISALGFWVGCGDSESTNPVSETTSSSGAGAGGGSTEPNGGGGTDTNGGGGTTSNGGAGGSGGAASNCLPASKYQDLFTIKDNEICAVAIYEGPAPTVPNFGTPGPIDFHTGAISFGSQGGPVIGEPSATDGSADLLRYTMTGATFNVDTKTADAMLTATDYLGATAIDLGFFGWTAIDYSAASGPGGFILLNGTTVVKSYVANSPYAIGTIVDSADQGRLIYTGLSKLDDGATSVNALYAADSCGTSATNPALEGCGAPIEIDAWGNESGPIAVDALGNAFAVMINAKMNQIAHGYAKKQIDRGAAPVVGATIFTVDRDSYGSALGAIAPTASEDGILAFQPVLTATGKAQDVIAQRYHLGSDVLSANGNPTTLLKLTKEDTAFSFATDPTSQLWVAATRTSGTVTKLVYVVLARKP